MCCSSSSSLWYQISERLVYGELKISWVRKSRQSIFPRGPQTSSVHTVYHDYLQRLFHSTHIFMIFLILIPRVPYIFSWYIMYYKDIAFVKIFSITGVEILSHVISSVLRVKLSNLMMFLGKFKNKCLSRSAPPKSFDTIMNSCSDIIIFQ